MRGAGKTDNVMRVRLVAVLFMLASVLPAREGTSYKSKPKNHEKNRQMSTNAYEAALVRYKGDTNILVLPGLVADKGRKRVEVMAETLRLRAGGPCEFTVIAETSDHGYEANLISFAKPSDVHRALQFIGTDPGESFDPGSLRNWAKGESVVLTLAWSNEPPLRLEQLLADKRTGKGLPETGFMFTGSRMVSSINDPTNEVYAADEYQPKSIVSLFNTPYSVLEVPYFARKEDVYQNLIVNPERELPEGEVVTLVIEPVNKDGARRVKDLVLQLQAGAMPTNSGLKERLSGLICQLKESETVLNAKPSLLSVFDALAALDRKKHDYYLAVSFGDGVELGDARALAMLFSTIDCERGVRIEPPPAGQLHYKAFIPPQQLLDRENRMYHPWELSLSEKDGHVSGVLLLVESVWKEGATALVLETTEFPVSSPQDLRKELDAEMERTRKADGRPKPREIMVFAPPTLKYSHLMNFLEPALPTHRTVHVYLDTPMPPIPGKKP